MKTLSIGLIIIVLLFGIILVGCAQQGNPANTGTTGQTQTNSSASNGNPQEQTTGAKTYTIDISGFAFSSSSLNINKGDTVIWTNKDSVPHTVTSDAGAELSSDKLSNGQTYSHTFNSAGTFAYHCSVHTSMKAEVVVI